MSLNEQQNPKMPRATKTIAIVLFVINFVIAYISWGLTRDESWAVVPYFLFPIEFSVGIILIVVSAFKSSLRAIAKGILIGSLSAPVAFVGALLIGLLAISG